MFFAKIRRVMLVGFVVAGMSGFASGNAAAGDYYHGRVRIHRITSYKTVIVFVKKTVPYKKRVVRYDHCGEPYYAYVTRYKVLRVPVKKYVRVGHYGY